MTEDFAFTAEDLVEGKLQLPNTRIVEFSVENNTGELVIPSRAYNELTGSTEVDFTGWQIEGAWHIRVIPVEKGFDAEPGISIEEYIVRMYLLKNDGRYFPYAGERPAFPISQTRNAPLLGNSFFASGTEQFVSGVVTPAIIPAFGDYRQYVGTTEISAGTEGVLYQFQVYREDLIVFDQIQDSLNFPASGTNHGNIFYISPNLIARNSESEPKYTYFWRVRASYKITDSSEKLYWSNWSNTFPFTINIPPGIPYNLSVFS